MIHVKRRGTLFGNQHHGRIKRRFTCFINRVAPEKIEVFRIGGGRADLFCFIGYSCQSFVFFTIYFCNNTATKKARLLQGGFQFCLTVFQNHILFLYRGKCLRPQFIVDRHIIQKNLTFKNLHGKFRLLFNFIFPVGMIGRYNHTNQFLCGLSHCNAERHQ